MKPIEWVGSSLKDLREFPEPVKDGFGWAPLDVQFGDTPHGAKPLKGFGGASVLEIVEDHDRSTYRRSTQCGSATWCTSCTLSRRRRRRASRLPGTRWRWSRSA